MTVYATAALTILVMGGICLFAAWVFRLCSDREIKRPEYQNRNSLEGMRLRASSEAYLRAEGICFQGGMLLTVLGAFFLIVVVLTM